MEAGARYKLRHQYYRMHAAEIPLRAGFTGKERDVKTGYDYGVYPAEGRRRRPKSGSARYYDSRIGRWLSVDPMAIKYAGWGPYVYSADGPTVFNDPNGKEIRNSGHYVIQNPRLVRALIQFNNALVEVTGKKTSEFVMEVTGGDRYEQFVALAYGAINAHRSRTNNGIIWKSDTQSPHLERNGARAVDLSLPQGITNEQIEESAAKAGFTQVLITQYKDGHFHLTLGKAFDKNGKVIPDVFVGGNRPGFEEKKRSSKKQPELSNHSFYPSAIDATRAFLGRGWEAE